MPNAHINYTALTHQLYTRYVSYTVHAVQCTCMCLASRTILLSISTFRGHRQASKSEWLYLSAHTCTVLPDRHENGFLYVWSSSHVDEASRTCTQCYTATPVNSTQPSLEGCLCGQTKLLHLAKLCISLSSNSNSMGHAYTSYAHLWLLPYAKHSKHCIYALGQPLHVQSAV